MNERLESCVIPFDLVLFAVGQDLRDVSNNFIPRNNLRLRVNSVVDKVIAEVRMETRDKKIFFSEGVALIEKITKEKLQEILDAYPQAVHFLVDEVFVDNFCSVLAMEIQAKNPVLANELAEEGYSDPMPEDDEPLTKTEAIRNALSNRVSHS